VCIVINQVKVLFQHNNIDVAHQPGQYIDVHPVAQAGYGKGAPERVRCATRYAGGKPEPFH